MLEQILSVRFALLELILGDGLHRCGALFVSNEFQSRTPPLLENLGAQVVYFCVAKELLQTTFLDCVVHLIAKGWGLADHLIEHPENRFGFLPKALQVRHNAVCESLKGLPGQLARQLVDGLLERNRLQSVGFGLLSD